MKTLRKDCLDDKEDDNLDIEVQIMSDNEKYKS